MKLQWDFAKLPTGAGFLATIHSVAGEKRHFIPIEWDTAREYHGIVELQTGLQYTVIL